jgi:hypothetical protein
MLKNSYLLKEKGWQREIWGTTAFDNELLESVKFFNKKILKTVQNRGERIIMANCKNDIFRF